MSETAKGKTDPAQWAALEARADAARAKHGILDICWLCPEDNPLGEYGWRPSGSDQAKYPDPQDNLAEIDPAFSDLLSFAADAGRCFDPGAADSTAAWLREQLRRWPSDRTGPHDIDVEGTGELVHFRTGALMDVWALFAERCAELAGKRKSHWSGVFTQARAGISEVPTTNSSPSQSEKAKYESLRSQAKTPEEWLKLDDERRAAQKPGPPFEPGYPTTIENPKDPSDRPVVYSKAQHDAVLAEWRGATPAAPAGSSESMEGSGAEETIEQRNSVAKIARQPRPDKGKRREAKATTQKIRQEYDNRGRPELGPPVLDLIASAVFPREAAKVTKGSLAHKRLRDRVRAAIRRQR